MWLLLDLILKNELLGVVIFDDLQVLTLSFIKNFILSF
jgi:hypothetical protein